MVINATLFVQAFNFFVSYLLLRYLFFKPVVKALQEENHEKENLERLISEREKNLEKMEEEKRRAWQESQAKFKKATPNVRQTKVVHADVLPEFGPEVISEDEVKRLAEDVRQELVKRVRHGGN